MQDFDEEGVGSTWIIDASTTGKGARKARENFCGARSIFSTELRQSTDSTPINSALCSSSTITTKTGSN